MAGNRNRCWASWTAVVDHYSSRNTAVVVRSVWFTRIFTGSHGPRQYL